MKTLVITGGTGGLGSEVVPRLAREYRCVVAYRTESSFRELKERVPAAEGIASLDAVAPYAPLHGVVLLAGAFTTGAAAADFQQMFEANVLSVAQALDATLPHLAEGARIVAIGSAASLTSPPGLAAYSASKSAVNAIVRTLAGELAPRKITVNALLPSALATAPMKSAMPEDQLVPLDRVAEWIAFLLSERGSGITGQLIEMRP